MYRNLAFSLCLFLFFSSKVYPQFNIIFIQANPYEFKVSEIHNFQLVNSENDQFIYVKSFVKFKGNHVYSLVSKPFESKSGVSQINLNSIGIVSEHKNSNQPFDILSATNVFPSGNYDLCYKVFSQSQNEELGEYCFNISVESISPPTLLSPSNEAEINIINPMLIWIGPTPMANNFKYDLKLSEIIANQSPVDAVTRNFGMIMAKGLTETQLLYPFTSPKLENGKRYAWQVIARSSTNAIETEVWSFKVKLDTVIEEKVVFFSSYLIPELNRNSGTVNIKNELRILINEEIPIKEINYQLLDINQNVIIDNEQFVVKKEEGNKFIFNFAQLEKLNDKAYYSLKIRGLTSKNTYYVFFRYFK